MNIVQYSPGRKRGEEEGETVDKGLFMSWWVSWALSSVCQVSVRKRFCFCFLQRGLPGCTTRVNTSEGNTESAEGQIITFRWLNVFRETKSTQKSGSEDVLALKSADPGQTHVRSQLSQTDARLNVSKTTQVRWFSLFFMAKMFKVETWLKTSGNCCWYD